MKRGVGIGDCARNERMRPVPRDMADQRDIRFAAVTQGGLPKGRGPRGVDRQRDQRFMCAAENRCGRVRVALSDAKIGEIEMRDDERGEAIVRASGGRRVDQALRDRERPFVTAERRRGLPVTLGLHGLPHRGFP
jgi:hypothetical protein